MMSQCQNPGCNELAVYEVRWHCFYGLVLGPKTEEAGEPIFYCKGCIDPSLEQLFQDKKSL